MSHGQGEEGSTLICSIILFPSQSHSVDLKDKGAGTALKMDEKLSTTELDTGPTGYSVLFGIKTIYFLVSKYPPFLLVSSRSHTSARFRSLKSLYVKVVGYFECGACGKTMLQTAVWTDQLLLMCVLYYPAS